MDGKGGCTYDSSLMPRLVAALCLEVLDLPDDALAVDDLAEHDVLLVQMWRQDRRDEELGSVRA